MKNVHVLIFRISYNDAGRNKDSALEKGRIALDTAMLKKGMNEMKHWGKTAVVLGLVAGLTACGNSEPAGNGSGNVGSNDTQNASAEDSTHSKVADGAAEAGEDPLEDTAEIVVAYYTSTEINMEDTQRVQDAINAITVDKINTEVTLLPISIGSWSQQLNLMISGGDQLDLVPTFFFGAGTFDSMRSSNQLMPLNDLLEQYGAGITAEVSADYLATTTYDGNIYAIPAGKDQVSTIWYAMRTDVLDSLGLTEKAENISSMQDIEEILAAVKENTDLTPLFGNGSSGGVLHFGNALVSGEFSDAVGVNKLVNDYIVTLDTEPQKVVNVYETEEYKASVELMYEWYQKGYIFQDATTTEEVNYDMVKNDKCFSFFYGAELSTKNSGLSGCGYDMTVVKVFDVPITTATVNTNCWGIPVNSKEPEAAMKFLNLMYSDKEIVDLLNYGIEDINYTVLDDGTYGPVSGDTAASSSYPLNLTWLFGNQYLSGVWVGDEPDLREQSREINASAEVSELLGFAARSDSFDTQISGITSACNEYISGLVCGVSNPEETLPQFNEKLKAAGIDELVSDVQAQLDEWLAQKDAQ